MKKLLWHLTIRHALETQGWTRNASYPQVAQNLSRRRSRHNLEAPLTWNRQVNLQRPLVGEDRAGVKEGKNSDRILGYPNCYIFKH